MPTVICNYCQYVGQGVLATDRWIDAERHEKTCEENPDSEKENQTNKKSNTAQKEKDAVDR